MKPADMICPPPLRPSDKVCIVSTARKVEPQFIESATKVLESWGLKVVYGNNLYGESHQFSGTDKERRDDINKAIAQPEIKAIFCARGGYGTARIVDGIDISALHKHPKWIIGYSDITALHSHLYRHGRINTIHGTMPVNFSTSTPEALESLRNLIFGEEVRYAAAPHHLNKAGIAEGVLLGGNLSVLYSLIKSPSEIDFDNAILFIEDLDEYLYHIDRMMLNLYRSGILSRLAGLMVGGMTDMRDNAIPFGKTTEEIIAGYTSEYTYPVCFGFPSGHIDDNRAWVHGKKIRLHVDTAQPSLVSYV